MGSFPYCARWSVSSWTWQLRCLQVSPSGNYSHFLVSIKGIGYSKGYCSCYFILIFYQLGRTEGIGGLVQTYMDSEIRAIMAQYMPLDSQGEVQNHSHNGVREP